MASMPTRKIGSDDVAEMGLGLMGLSTWYGKVESDEERLKFLDTAFEDGWTNWDSADIYGDSEDLVGKWFKRTGNRHRIFLASKCGFFNTANGLGINGSPEYIKSACTKSLSRLGVDQIDLYYLHRADTTVPIEKSIGAMAELVKEGKIRYIGLSEASAATLRRAHAVHPITAYQVEYSPFSLDIEDEKIALLKICRELGIAVVAYSPLGRGLLTGQYRSPDDFEDGDFRKFLPRFNKDNFPNVLKIADGIAEIGKAHNATAGPVTLAWVLAQGKDVIPIPGTNKVKYLKENLAAIHIKLSNEEQEKIRKLAEGADIGDRVLLSNDPPPRPRYQPAAWGVRSVLSDPPRAHRQNIGFHTPALKLLYKNLVLGPTKPGPTYKAQTALELRDVIMRHPSVAKFLEEVTLTNHGPLYTWLNQEETHWLESDAILDHLFRQCSNLRRLALVGCENWDMEANRFNYRWFSESVKKGITQVIPQLTSLKLQYVAYLPNDFFFILPASLKELILHFSNWDFSSPPPYPPPSAWFESAEKKRCQLERLCLFVANIDATMVISTLLDQHYGFGITRLRALHLDLMEHEDHWCSMVLLHCCRKTLEILEYSPSEGVVDGEYPEIVDYSGFENLEHLVLRLPVTLYSEDNVFDCVEKTAGWLLAVLNGLARSPSRDKLKTFYIRLYLDQVESEETQVDDDGAEATLLEPSHVERGFESWRTLDRLFEDNCLPNLEKVIIDILPAGRLGEIRNLRSFSQALKRNLAAMKKKKVLMVREQPSCDDCVLSEEAR
ncbi:hypothetical protein NP233_g2448 [Leucocoprinus birnbaumii]|uniref:NADP-dependent oxidoreductase domain-containing protein n=1 Tax=Leucocoprinus birnbaumii TaxID=56174 RepID=A0AAD5YXA2_9AGAR|nr:hypothetical protein NP233_g2448 [Leucocoprinus birnbaumii]